MTSYLRVIGSLLSIYLTIGKSNVCGQNFIASFQPGLEGAFLASTNAWIEFSKPILPTKEFTACHWIKIKFQNLKIAANLWSYCTIENAGDKMKCLQAFMHGNVLTANRDLIFQAYIPSKKGNKKTTMAVDSFPHRTWTHFCWSFSSINGENRFYHNGIFLGIHKLNFEDFEMAMEDANNMDQSAFIFGQEPDNMRGGFDSHQSFLGDLSELNIWNYTMSEVDIMKMATCKTWLKGNIVSWERSNLILNNIVLTDLFDPPNLCLKHHQYVIFPEKVPYPEAKGICEIHGGSLAVPKSEEENNQIINIVFKHKKTCIEKENLSDGNAVWIGAKKVDRVWYEVSTSFTTGGLLNYTKVSKTTTNPNSKCTYLRNDGSWLGGRYVCTNGYLCTVCNIPNQPVFTVKGVCGTTDIDWNYYLSVDTNYQVNFYEGYKKTNILLDENSQKWYFTPVAGFPLNFNAEFSPSKFTTKYPVGRNQWIVNDAVCDVEDKLEALTLSNCNFPTQFTCDSGHCIDISKRCDEQKDCLDGSDEKLCSLISIPPSYNKVNAPEPNIENVPLQINMHPTVISIDGIDTVNMIVTLTMEIRLNWHDKRLNYFNPLMDKDNMIPSEMTHQLWTPMRDLIHENAIIGEIKYNNDYNVKLLSNAPEGLDTSKAIENRLFNGSYNPLEVSQRLKIKYNCIFEVKKFPFDDQNCSFIMKIKQRQENASSFVSDGHVLYKGTPLVDQFSIGQMRSKIENTKEFTTYIIIIPMKRMFTNQLLTSFIPTLILWLFGYSTLFIDAESPSDRFMGAGTALLVVATLLNAINGGLPKTSYMKYIDLWFIWHVGSIFAMITYHIILDRLRIYFEKTTEDDVLPFKTTDYIALMKKNGGKKIIKINNSFIMLFPILNTLFYVIYFYLTLN